MGNIARVVGDHPVTVTVSLVGLVATHATLTEIGVLANVWRGLVNRSVDAQVSVHLGLAGVAAITAGFAGVVVVFVLQSSSPRFRNFRLQASRSVRATSFSIVAAPMSVALLGLAGALLSTVSRAWFAVWLLELGLLVLLHGYVRMLFYFRSMIRLVSIDDSAEARAERQRVIAARIGTGPQNTP